MKQNVATSVAKGTHFLPSMTETHRRILHTSVTKAIDDNTKVKIGLTQNSPRDGLLTMDLMEKRYGHIVKTSQQHIALPGILTNTTKRQNDTIMKYHQRFEFHVACCRANNMFLFENKKDLYALYLRNMKEPALQSIIVGIETDDVNAKQWIDLTDLVAVRDKAETIITADNALNPTHQPNPPSNSNSSTSQSSEEALKKGHKK